MEPKPRGGLNEEQKKLMQQMAHGQQQEEMMRNLQGFFDSQMKAQSNCSFERITKYFDLCIKYNIADFFTGERYNISDMTR